MLVNVDRELSATIICAIIFLSSAGKNLIRTITISRNTTIILIPTYGNISVMLDEAGEVDIMRTTPKIKAGLIRY